MDISHRAGSLSPQHIQNRQLSSRRTRRITVPTRSPRSPRRLTTTNHFIRRSSWITISGDLRSHQEATPMNYEATPYRGMTRAIRRSAANKRIPSTERRAYGTPVAPSTGFLYSVRLSSTPAAAGCHDKSAFQSRLRSIVAELSRPTCCSSCGDRRSWRKRS